MEVYIRTQWTEYSVPEGDTKDFIEFVLVKNKILGAQKEDKLRKL